MNVDWQDLGRVKMRAADLVTNYPSLRDGQVVDFSWYDYLDFLIAISKKENKLLPPRVQEAMANASLLFVGYRIADWNFRVLFRSVVTSLEAGQKRKHVSVQILPIGNATDTIRKLKVLSYLDKYYQELNTRVYWGRSDEFMAELRQIWEEG